MGYGKPPLSYTRWLGAAICTMIAGCAAGATPAPTPRSVTASPTLSSTTATEIATALGPSGFTMAPAPAMAAATVAVADFEGGSIPADKKTDFWGRALASFMIADLAASQNLRVVDREHLAAVLGEQQLGATDLSDAATRLRVGKILGAKYFIFGTYTIVGDQAALTARMDAVETGLIVESRTATGKEDDMRTLSEQLAADFLSPLDQVVAAQELASTPLSSGPPASAREFFNHGLVYEQKNDYQKAIDLYTQALSVYPHYTEAREHLQRASEAAARQ
jgi:TolB-like protein